MRRFRTGDVNKEEADTLYQEAESLGNHNEKVGLRESDRGRIG